MRRLRLSMAVLAPTLLLACGSQTGKVTVLLKDAPGDITSAVVTITEVDLVDSGGVTVLSTQKVTTDLLTLQNEAATLVKDAVVPSGTYTQLRFKITGGYIAVEQSDGGSIIYASSPTYEGLPQGAQVGGTLQMPSYAQSGLKVDLPGGGVNVGTDSKVLVVDFKVDQSFGHDAGDSGSWVMHPVITAMDIQFSGSLMVTLKLATGVTLPQSAALWAVLSSPDMSPKTMSLPPGGSATFSYLTPGDYLLDITTTGLTSATFDPTVPATVTVSSGQMTTASFVLTPAQ